MLYLNLSIAHLCVTLRFLFDSQGVPMESQPSKLAGSRGSKNRYFDFDKLAEVCFLLSCISHRVVIWLV